MDSFRERFIELLKSTNKQQKEIAKELNRTPQTLTNWKSGYNEPNIADLINIAEYFDVTVDYLIGRDII